MNKRGKQRFACVLCLFFVFSVFGGGLVSSREVWHFGSWADDSHSADQQESEGEVPATDENEDIPTDTESDENKTDTIITEPVEEEVGTDKVGTVENGIEGNLLAERLKKSVKPLERMKKRTRLQTVGEAENFVALADDSGSGNVLSIETGAAVETAENSHEYRFPNLIVNVPEGRDVASVTIQFTSAIESGDCINLNGTTGFTRLAGSKNGNVTINAEGTKTKAEWENYLRSNLSISLPSGQTSIRKLRFSAS